MALKKQINEEFFLYAQVNKIELPKNNPICFILLVQKRNSQNEVLDVDPIYFHLPEMYLEFFGTDALSKSEMNPHKAIYEWIKINKPLFLGWEDC